MEHLNKHNDDIDRPFKNVKRNVHLIEYLHNPYWWWSLSLSIYICIVNGYLEKTIASFPRNMFSDIITSEKRRKIAHVVINTSHARDHHIIIDIKSRQIMHQYITPNHIATLFDKYPSNL